MIRGVLVALALAGCAGEASKPAVRLGVDTPTACHARGVAPNILPDPVCTPGVVDPAVTQANIQQTICVVGYTRTVRPPTSYTSPLERAQMILYGFTDSPDLHEEDHLIPLQLGGSPRDPANLWPEPDASPNAKDVYEGRLKRAVCAGTVTLAAAQAAIALDWPHALELVAAWCPPTSSVPASTTTTSSAAPLG